jgi:membrane-bound lytic murein transglycosylase B
MARLLRSPRPLASLAPVPLRVVFALLLILLAWPAVASAQEPFPAPDERLPRGADALASRLEAVMLLTNEAADAWLQSDEAAEEPPEDVLLGALYQQRVARALARQPALEGKVLARLPSRLRPGARDPARALRALFRLNGPAPARPRPIRVGAALSPAELRGLYDEAARRFGIPWNVLAAVNLVETNFNRNRNVSSAGAQGPMQFLPSTWRAYGLGGDIRDPHDAILGAANYLRASGGRSNLRRALFAYNHSSLYVDAVLLLARRIWASERSYVTLWSWQVFQRTRQGDRRLTGPGLE